MLKKLPRYTSVTKLFDRKAARRALAAFFVLTLFSQPLHAQGVPKNIDPELAKKILGSGVTPDQGDEARKSALDQAREAGAVAGAIAERSERLRGLKQEEPFSLIERSFIRRIFGAGSEQTLRQFGYDNFRRAARPIGFSRSLFDREEQVPLTGAISESYVLGIGDDMVVTYQGRDEVAFTARIDREGQLVLPKLSPIPAAGRTFGQLRSDVEARVASTLVGTQVFISLGTVRAISVYVVGEVEEPGLHHLSSLSTILDALVKAGGVLKTGSLRQIEITRGDRRFLLDSYDLMITGGPNYDLSLQDGDRVFVPTVASVAAVAGDVQRPGIYELPYGRQEISVAELVRLSGGPVLPRGNRVVLVSTDVAGRAITSEPDDLSTAMIRAGEFVQVISLAGLEGGVITVQGHVNNPGSRSLARIPTLGALLSGAEVFKTDPYLNFAVLRRSDPASLTTVLLPVNLRPILAGEVDIGLQNRDILSVFSVDNVRFLTSPRVQAAIRGRSETPPLEEEEGVERLEIRRFNAAEKERTACPAIDQLALMVDGGREGRLERAKYFSRNFSATEIGNPEECPKLFRENPELLLLLLEHAAVLAGEVRRPGIFPVTEGARLAGILSAAGGLTVEADVKKVEVSHSVFRKGDGVVRNMFDLSSPEAAHVSVYPGDNIRINAIVSSQDRGPVILGGEVRRPGIYSIRRGERLSELIDRAGGLTQHAFPTGTVFTREAARQHERRSFDRLADQLQLSLASNILGGVGFGVDDAGGVTVAAQELVSQLRETEAVGRVVIEADPTVLALDPSLDTILEPADRVYVPKRPNWISVSGAVLSPATVQFAPGSDPRDYIEMVGGFSDAADEGLVFVVYPNGIAQPVRTSFWNFQSVQLIPGSSIIVPMDATPFRFLPIAREVTTILSQMSLAAASLAVINRD